MHGHVVGWDLAADRQVPGTAQLDVPGDLTLNVVFTHDGSLALGACESRVILWDTRSGRRVHEMSGHLGRVNAVTLSEAQQLAASGADDHLVKMWDLHDGRELLSLHGHTDRIVSVCLSESAGRLFSAGDDQRLIAWDLSLASTYRDFETRFAAPRQSPESTPPADLLEGCYARSSQRAARRGNAASATECHTVVLFLRNFRRAKPASNGIADQAVDGRGATVPLTPAGGAMYCTSTASSRLPAAPPVMP